MASQLTINLEKLSRISNTAIPLLAILFGILGYYVSFYYHFLTVAFCMLSALNFFYRHIQKSHALLRNFGILAQIRYILESVGPEFRQYLYSSDTEEKPFNRIERGEVYKKAKGMDSTMAFGSQHDYDSDEIKLRHSMFPMDSNKVEKFSLTFGEERSCKNAFTMHKPVIVSAMSYGALSSPAVRSIARGARLSGTLMNTGEGGWPKYHLMENCDLIFQMGTAKFGVRNEDSSLNDEKLEKLASLDQIKMIEIKFSQGAKPGKGGLLPKEKITEEISHLRGVPMGRDVVSPAYHIECINPEETVKFIRRVQEVSGLPVGIKFCFGREIEFRKLIICMKNQNTFPDYISIDGGEGGTGAAPKPFMDDVGMPLFKALPIVIGILAQEGVRDKVKLLCAGKLINAGKQLMAMSLGADAVYTARGFLLALGCIQALQCNNNTCPVGITSHLEHLSRGIDIDKKSQRVANYANHLEHDHIELLSAMGMSSHRELTPGNIYIPQGFLV